MSVKRDYGFNLDRRSPQERGRLIAYINVKLAGLGLPIYSRDGTSLVELTREMLRNYREKNRLLADYLPPADRRIQDFLDRYLSDLALPAVPHLPSNTLTLDRYGMARELSLPPHAHKHVSPTLSSYRIRNGILHNPANDRRTTQGVFHVAEGGLPIPLDKKSVPKIAFARLLAAAFDPPGDLLTLPFTSDERPATKTMVSLLMRPFVQPAVQGACEERSMEVRFFAPGSLAANLDFVESIFGNSGDPYVSDHDAALDPLHWTGHSGCIILATHLVNERKKDLGLPRWEDATERQRKDGMCWKAPEEKYNEGKPFKICARDESGVIVTIIADNYFGYSKKEVKAHISYSSNLLGLTEEEHSGGALVMPSYNHGTRFVPDTNLHSTGQSFEDTIRLLRDRIEVHPEGYATDLTFPNIVYLPEDAVISLEDQKARWIWEGSAQEIRVLPDEYYIHPTGYRVRMDRHGGSGAWRLVGTSAEGLLCHKPCTVSGGGKSEISKSIWDAISFAPITIGDFAEDLAAVDAIIDYNYGNRFRDPGENHGGKSRTILSERRSLGSVIKLFSPTPLYTDEYNDWLASIPERIKALVFLVKRFYRPDWGKDWKSKFSVDVVNGATGNVIKFEGRPVQGSYLRVGYSPDNYRWMVKLRQDFLPAEKIQWEDDITASVILPVKTLTGLPDTVRGSSVKFARNCEARFFQRPDDAIHRGYDKQAEIDMSRQDNFISNFEPLTRARAKEMIEHTIELTEYTDPMRVFIEDAEKDDAFEYFVVSSHPRMVDGKPSQNPRYLQMDPGYVSSVTKYLADVGARLFRGIKADSPVQHPVGAILPGRRNNPADHEARIRPLSVYGPIHYQELPELFMDFICSLTGKSPSTTGAGSEGALTKGPFNSLVPTTDLNNALLGFILTGYDGFSTAAGYIGHKYKMDHDVSLLVPELWARLTPEERDPEFLIAHGYLERLEDFTHGGKTIPAGRLGYRITPLFASHFLGRIFDTPAAVFPEEVLRPELQDMADYVDGILNISETQGKVARNYIEDGSVAGAIPPLAAIIRIMAEGSWEGKTLLDPAVRTLFDRETVLASGWYRSRLDAYVARERAYMEKSISYLDAFLAASARRDEDEIQAVKRERDAAAKRLSELCAEGFAETLVGTIGLDPVWGSGCRQPRDGTAKPEA